MKRIIWRRFIGFLILASVLTGCATTTLKTTPIWDEDYGKGIGPTENRVNVWPLLYLRKPALSVLWPLFTKTEEGNAFVPFYEYQNAERDLRLGTVHPEIPALFAEFNGVKDYRRVLNFAYDGKTKRIQCFPLYFQSFDPADPYELLFPIYHHSKNGYWTPLVTWRKDFKGIAGPLFNRHVDGDCTYWNLPYPLIGWWHGKNEAGSRLFPLYAWGRDTKGVGLNVGYLLYVYERSGDRVENDYLIPLGWTGHDSKSRWNHFLPFWYSKSDANGSLLVSLPLFSSSDGKTTTTMALLNGYFDRHSPDGRYQAWFWPFVSRFSNDRGRGHAVIPLYLFKENIAGVKTFFSPPVSWSSDGSMLNVGVILYHGTNRDGRREGSLMWPLTHWWSDKKKNDSGSAVLPLYWWQNQGADNKLFLSPLGGFSRTPDDTSIDLLGPLYYSNASRDGKKLYRTMLWPVWHQGRNGDSRQQALVPLYYLNRAKDKFDFFSIPFFHSKDKHDSKYAALLNTVGWSRGLDSPRLSHHVFPLYFWDSSAENSGFGLGMGLICSFWHSRLNQEALRERLRQDFTSRIRCLEKFQKDKTGREVSLEDRPGYEGFPYNDTQQIYERQFLCGLFPAETSLHGRIQPMKQGEKPAPGEETIKDDKGKDWRLRIQEEEHVGRTLLYRFDRIGDQSQRRQLLWRLYDSIWRREDDNIVYTRQRVLWRIFHRETKGEQVSTDVFPFIAYDRNPSKKRNQWSFAGGLIGFKKEKDARVLLLFWLPIPL